jgi:hypothetical protein
MIYINLLGRPVGQVLSPVFTLSVDLLGRPGTIYFTSCSVRYVFMHVCTVVVVVVVGDLIKVGPGPFPGPHIAPRWWRI